MRSSSCKREDLQWNAGERSRAFKPLSVFTVPILYVLRMPCYSPDPCGPKPQSTDCVGNTENEVTVGLQHAVLGPYWCKVFVSEWDVVPVQ